jgi:hypothetical protein
MIFNKEQLKCLYDRAHEVPSIGGPKWFEPGELVLGGGGALMAMGIRENTQDLNVWVSPERFKELNEKGRLVWCTPGTGIIRLLNKSQQPFAAIHCEVRPFDIPHDTVEIDGMTCFDPMTLLTYKQCLKREWLDTHKEPQDLKDIAALNQFMADRAKG